MAAFEVKRVSTMVDYLDVEASNEEEAIERVVAGMGEINASGGYVPTHYEAHFLFDSEAEGWVPEDEEDDFFNVGANID